MQSRKTQGRKGAKGEGLERGRWGEGERQEGGRRWEKGGGADGREGDKMARKKNKLMKGTLKKPESL